MATEEKAPSAEEKRSLMLAAEIKKLRHQVAELAELVAPLVGDKPGAKLERLAKQVRGQE